MMQNMKAIQVANDQSLSWTDFKKPIPDDYELLIKVAATAINRADLVQRSGGYPPPPGVSPIMGLECAGEVVAIGASCSRYKEGDMVCALLPGGGYAEYAVADENSVLPVPDGLTLTHAAGLPEVFATAWLNLFMEGGVQPGEKVVLHAGASGVGTAAIQICRTNAVETFVTVGSDRKLNACIQLGASGGVNRKKKPILDAVVDFWSDGVDLVLDPVGASYLADNIKMLAFDGRLVLIGLMGGARAQLDLASLMMKRIRVIGSTLRARPLQEKGTIMQQLEERVWPCLKSGEIDVSVESVLPITEAKKGHDLIASDQTIGKVILELNH